MTADGGATHNRTHGGTSESGAAAARMHRAIDAASKGAGSRDELKAAARELVQTLRADEQRPEQALLFIKKLLADSGLRPSYASPADGSAPVAREEAVYRDVIAWSIRYYYADGDGTSSGSS